MFSVRGNALVAEVAAAGLFLAGCSSDPKVAAPEAPSTPATAPAVLPTTAPAAPHENQPAAATFSKTLRGALQDNHDQTADNHFSNAVLNGTVTKEQYTVALKQNLAIFECMHEVISADQQLPAALRNQFLVDLSEVVAAFKKDLGMSSSAKVADTDVLTSTRALVERLRSQSSNGIAVCAYLDLGGNAFGTHDLAEALETKGLTNTAGFTTYTRERFRELAAQMNNTFSDQSQYPQLVEAGRGFYQAHARIYAADVFLTK